MTLENMERVKILARSCAELVGTYDEENKTESSVEFVAFWNNAIRFVTPLEFCRLICDELTKGTSNE